MVELARGLICEPDLPIKLSTGREKEARRCLRCFQCVNQDYLNGHLYCAINPESGKEYEVGCIKPVKEKKSVLVVGGGIAGMQAAITAAEEGHKVTLCEKDGELGGVILCERNVPFKKRIDEYIEQQKYLIGKAGIDVRLNTEVTPRMAGELRPDVIIAALGAGEFRPELPGIDGDNVKTAAQVFRQPGLAGRSAVILGAGLTGIELAIYLKELGVSVEIAEMAPKTELSEIYTAKMLEIDLEVNWSTKAKAVTDRGVLCDTPEGERLIEGETVILAMGMRPLWAEATALNGCAGEFHMIGDCRAPRNIIAATGEGWTAARNIGRY